MKNKPDLEDKIVFWIVSFGTLTFLFCFMFCMVYPHPILFIVGFTGLIGAVCVPLGFALYNDTYRRKWH